MNSVVFIILALILSIGALAAVAYPVLARARSPRLAVVSAQERLEELLAQRDAAYQALRELNFDHRVGKITDDDFTAFEDNLKHVAAAALRALDEFEGEVDTDLDSYIERTVAARRAALAGAEPARSCPACGHAATPDDKFCAGCGASLSAAAAPPPSTAAAAHCPHCGKPVSPADRFCASCGKPVGRAAPVAVR
jgi:hypothetical protein